MMVALPIPLWNVGAWGGMQRGRSKPVRIQAVRIQEVAVSAQRDLPTAALAVSWLIRSVAHGHVDFSHRIDHALALRPSSELLALCADRLQACERDFHQANMRLSIYVRTPECYATGELELMHVAWRDADVPPAEKLVLLFKSSMKASMQDVEVALAEGGAAELPQLRAIVVPMIKELCLVGLLIAEQVSPESAVSEHGFKTSKGSEKLFQEQEAELMKLAHYLVLACVLDQRAALLQQASWQKSVKIGNLIEQARSSLFVMRTLGKMLAPRFQRGDISRDLLEDILVQGDRAKDILHEIQEALYFNNLGGNMSNDDDSLAIAAERTSVQAAERDEEMPMPPLTLAPLQLNERSCNVAPLLGQLVDAGKGMAAELKLKLELRLSADSLVAAVDENSLRQVMSKLVDSAMQRTPAGGCVRVAASAAPGGGVLIITEDNGPDMSFMAHWQGPLGTSRSLPLESSLTALKLARDILESSGAVLRFTSPYLQAGRKRGGVRVEVWIPSPTMKQLS